MTDDVRESVGRPRFSRRCRPKVIARACKRMHGEFAIPLQRTSTWRLALPSLRRNSSPGNFQNGLSLSGPGHFPETQDLYSPRLSRPMHHAIAICPVCPESHARAPSCVRGLRICGRVHSAEQRIQAASLYRPLQYVSSDSLDIHERMVHIHAPALRKKARPVVLGTFGCFLEVDLACRTCISVRCFQWLCSAYCFRLEPSAPRLRILRQLAGRPLTDPLAAEPSASSVSSYSPYLPQLM